MMKEISKKHKIRKINLKTIEDLTLIYNKSDVVTLLADVFKNSTGNCYEEKN